MNEFEKHIQEHKERFNTTKLDSRIWDSIENEILRSKVKRRSILWRWSSAAAAILVLGILFYGIMFSNQLTEEEVLRKYGLVQSEYVQQIEEKEHLISMAAVPSNSVEDFQVLLNQLEFLDKQYRDYLLYIEKNGYHPFIGQQFIQYYKSRIDLLDKIQQEIETVNYYETKFPDHGEQVGLRI